MPIDDNNVSDSSPETPDELETVDATEEPSEETTDTPEEEDSAPSDQSEAKAETEAASEPAKQKQDRETPAEKRIRQLIAKQKQLEQQIRQQHAPSPTAVNEPKKPKQEDFQSWDAFEAAKDDYYEKMADFRSHKAIEADRKARAEDQQRREFEETQREARESFDKRLADAKKRNPDIDVAKALKDVQPNQALDMFLAKSEIGPDVLDYLQKHPDEAERLREFDPIDTVLEAGRIQARLLDQIKGIKVPPKGPPKPPSYVSGQGSAPRKERSYENLLYGDD